MTFELFSLTLDTYQLSPDDTAFNIITIAEFTNDNILRIHSDY
jgi:hypothetical protein